MSDHPPSSIPAVLYYIHPTGRPDKDWHVTTSPGVVEICVGMDPGRSMRVVEYAPRTPLADAAPDLLAELERLEWAVFGEAGGSCCPSCLEVKESGHEPGCTLDAALKKARGA